MNTVPELIKQIRDYAKRADLADATASLWVFNDGKRLEKLSQGKASITMRRMTAAEAMLQRLERELGQGIKRNPWPKTAKKPAPKKKRQVGQRERVAA